MKTLKDIIESLNEGSSDSRKYDSIIHDASRYGAAVISGGWILQPWSEFKKDYPEAAKTLIKTGRVAGFVMSSDSGGFVGIDSANDLAKHLRDLH